VVSKLTLKKWGWNVLIGIDQLINAIACGDPDETLSSRAGKIVAKHGRGRLFWYCLCRVLHVFDKGHCHNSIEYDEGEPLTKPNKKGH